MATVTPNFGWDVPQSTDLVKDGATAIAALGNDIDTSLVDLKGGTTGQVLSKASNTDMDFTWVAQDDSNAIQNALLTTTGDTIYASSASTPARLGIGSTGQVLTVSGGLPVWATPSAGAYTLLSTTTLSGATVTVSSISQSYSHLFITLENPVAATNQVEMFFRINNDSTASRYAELQGFGASNSNQVNLSRLQCVYGLGNTDRNYFGFIEIPNYTNTTMWKSGFVFAAGNNAWNNNYASNTIQYWVYNQTTAVSSISFHLSSGNFSSGSIKVYGVK